MDECLVGEGADAEGRCQFGAVFEGHLLRHVERVETVLQPSASTARPGTHHDSCAATETLDGDLILPRGLLPLLTTLIGSTGSTLHIDDTRIHGTAQAFTCSAELRPEQQQALRATDTADGSLIVAPTTTTPTPPSSPRHSGSEQPDTQHSASPIHANASTANSSRNSCTAFVTQEARQVIETGRRHNVCRTDHRRSRYRNRSPGLVYLLPDVRQTMGMSEHAGAPFSFAEVRPYEVVDSLTELHGPEHGVLELPVELAWGGRTEFDLDDAYDRTAVYKIVLEEGTDRHLRELISGRLLVAIWPQMRPARPVRALWERKFPQLRAAA